MPPRMIRRPDRDSHRSIFRRRLSALASTCAAMALLAALFAVPAIAAGPELPAGFHDVEIESKDQLGRRAL